MVDQTNEKKERKNRPYRKRPRDDGAYILSPEDEDEDTGKDLPVGCRPGVVVDEGFFFYLHPLHRTVSFLSFALFRSLSLCCSWSSFRSWGLPIR